MSRYKPDWQEARDRMTAWWTGKKTDRVPAHVVAPLKPRNPRIASTAEDVPAKYTDPETVFRNLEYRLERTFWGGEKFPVHFVYFGPMFSLAYLGCEPVFMPNTTWYHPCFQDWSELQKVRFDPNNHWYQSVMKMKRLSVERADGRYLTTAGAQIAALMDVICGLLGNEKTMIAMLEQPDFIKTVRDRMMPWSRQTVDDTYEIVRHSQVGTIDWMEIWAPRRVVSSQCDMSVMISPEMFRDFVVPELTDIYNHVDYGIYHMDGPEQIRHLDMLLQIEKLHLIQWQPGTRMNDPGHRDPMNWLDLFRRIQEAGKKVYIYCPPERVRPLLDKIARDRVLLSVGCKDEQTARNVLRELDSIGM